MKAFIFAALLAVVLTACKPPKFESAIDCPAFHANGVAVYRQDYEHSYLVLFQDRSWVTVNETQCVISPARPPSPRGGR